MGTGFYLAIMIAYSAVMIGIGFALRKQASKSMDDFGIASNRFGSAVLAIVSIGAWVGSAGLIGLTSSGYTDGVMGYWEYAMGYISMLPFVFLFVTRIKFLKLFTIPDFFALRYSKYGEAIRYPTGVLYMVRNATILGMQLNALSFLFTAFFDMDHAFGVFLAAGIVVFYTAMSGFLSVMITNVIQSAFQTLAPFVALFFVLRLAGGWDNIAGYYADLNISGNLSLFNSLEWVGAVVYYAFTVGLFFIIADQGDWQRIGAAKNAKVARNSLLVGTIAVLPILVLPCYVGAGARYVMGEGVTPNLVFYELIKLGSPLIAALLLVGALSTIMSCTSTYLFAGGMNISHDLIVPLIKARGQAVDDKKEIFYSRIGVALCCGVGILFALRVQGLIALWSAGLSICASGLVVPFVFAWFNKKSNTESALAGMIAGGVVAFVWTMLGNPFGLDPIWIGLPVSIIACAIVPLFTPKPSASEVEATYYFSEKFKNAAAGAEQASKA
ncbi:MAG: sodium:solute symporter family protein [Clostridiales Family XIII bacterium]|jgi:Na+/proline symporter|nr:sodium:solute symporter family protein [Clostridiales Family XIII bacterium]